MRSHLRRRVSQVPPPESWNSTKLARDILEERLPPNPRVGRVEAVYSPVRHALSLPADRDYDRFQLMGGRFVANNSKAEYQLKDRFTIVAKFLAHSLNNGVFLD